MAYTPNNFETAKHLSNLIGSTTMTFCDRSYSGKRFGIFLQNVHRSDYDTKRALLTPDELMRLPSDTAIIMLTGWPPILGKKLRYYTDDTLLGRSEILHKHDDFKIADSEWSQYHHNDTAEGISETDILI